MDYPNSTTNLIMNVENCSFQFGNISLAKDHGVTCLGHAPILTTQAFIRTGILGIMSILSFIGNVMAIISVTRNKNRTPLCSLILNLSIADLFVSVFCLCVQAIWTYTVSWNAGNLMCKFVKYWQMFALYLSTFMVVVIGLDRWQAIAHPLKRSRRGRLFNKISCAIAYILSAVLSLPQIAIFRVSKGPFIEEFYQCVTYGFYTAKWQEQMYSILSLLFIFIVPLIILFITYFFAFIKLKESEKTLMRSSLIQQVSRTETLRQQKMKRASKKSFKMSLYIIGGFLICWIPYHTVMIVLLFKLTSNKIGQALLDAIFCFGMSNSLFNPIVYGVFHRARNSSSLSHEMTQIKYTKPFYNNRRKRESSRDGCQRNGSSYGKSQATQHEFFELEDEDINLEYISPEMPYRGVKSSRKSVNNITFVDSHF